MIEYIDIIGTILAFIGSVCIIKKKWYGYIFWLLANFSWVYIGINANAWGQVFTFGIMFNIINLWGIWEWEFRNKKRPKPVQFPSGLIPKEYQNLTIYDTKNPIKLSDLNE